MTITEQAGARAGLYRLLAFGLDYPRRELYEALRTGEFQEGVAAIGSALQITPVELPVISCEQQDLESEYIAAFEFGRNGEPACSLQEGSYLSQGLSVPLPEGKSGCAPLLEDIIRFYHHFGLKLTDDPAQRLPPDHLVCQLEMLSHLSLRESAAKSSSSITSYRSAQRDFLRRHISVWLPRLIAALHACPLPNDVRRFYFAVAETCMASVTAHLKCYS